VQAIIIAMISITILFIRLVLKELEPEWNSVCGRLLR
jgi:hypothetical protein